MQLGISLSHRQLNKLKIDLDYALNESINQSFVYIRLSLYWDEIEKKSGIYDFSKIKKILNFYQKHQQAIVLTVGVKAQRWPEYYWPQFIKEKNLNNQQTQKSLLQYIEASISELKTYSCIKYWQLENEPLDPSGPEEDTISFNFLQKEAKLIRELDQRPLILNLWGNEIIKRNLLAKLSTITDNIGLDLYYKQFVGEVFGHSIYRGPVQNTKQLKKYLAKFPKINFWITELQAEPWEKDEKAYLSASPKSINSQQLLQNFKKAKSLGIDRILFWGFEYWLWRKLKGDDSYLVLIKNLKN
jgi:GH35 family endo-1,4-beta-xylanase